MKAGDIATNFTLKDQDGNDFELYNNLNQPLLLVFYPKDNTLVCSNQLANYNENLDEFINNDIKVVGISTDSINSHSKFCNKLNLNFPLLSDQDKKVSKMFDALNFMGMKKRLLVLIGKNKKVLWMDSTSSITYMKTGEIIEKVKVLNMKEMT